jgi:4'-phosphopantetheinyl transferase
MTSAPTTTAGLELAGDEVHLFALAPGSVDDEASLAACHRVLDGAEREQQRRFVFAEDRHLYLVAHATVRACLSRYADVRPSEWVFSRNDYGRPEVARPRLERHLRFNLSHTRGMIAVLVGWERDLGVDVEDTARRSDPVEVADSFFAPDEVRTLRALPRELWRRRFFELWTLKESYIKARGMGLAIPLDGFAFDLAGGPPSSGEIRIRFAPSVVDDPAAWRFSLFALSPTHQGAAAVRLGTRGPPLRIVEKNPPPLGALG